MTNITHTVSCYLIVCSAALIVKWSPLGDSYAVAIGNKAVVYKLAVSTSILMLNNKIIVLLHREQIHVDEQKSLVNCYF